MDRRTTIQWMLTAATVAPTLGSFAFAGLADARTPAARGYGTDPKLLDPNKPGVLWPLTFTKRQRVIATALSDLIIPADDASPSASAVGVVDFLDEWISAPYERQQADRKIVLAGFRWLDRQSAKRYSQPFASLDTAKQSAICDDICDAAKAEPRFAEAATFFARYRDLTAGGFYTTPQGRKDLQYVGNVALATFDGPPVEALRKAGLA
jgi:hypothetical protein